MGTNLKKKAKENKTLTYLSTLDQNLPEIRAAKELFQKYQIEDVLLNLSDCLMMIPFKKKHKEYFEVLSVMNFNFSCLLSNVKQDNTNVFILNSLFKEQVFKNIKALFFIRDIMKDGVIDNTDCIIFLHDLQITFLKAYLINTGNNKIITDLEKGAFICSTQNIKRRV